MIVGIGIDVVSLERFEASLERTPDLARRVFTDAEREGKLESLAATFAAKEAVAKALGAPGDLAWHDVEVRRESDGRPSLYVKGSVAAAALDRGIDRWHISLSHDAGVATAMVIAESS